MSHTRGSVISGKDQVLKLARRKRVLRTRDLDEAGLSRELLRRLHAEGKLERRARGIYVLPGLDLGEQQMLVETARRVPHGVICLLTALRFHDLTTQNPADIWVAIDQHARAPREPNLPLRIIRVSGVARTAGVTVHRIQTVAVPITDPAKTVVDCFKFRRIVGIDIAIEALRDAIRSRRVKIDDLWTFAAIDRVQRVMRPYLESAT
jgi:predicted transcriptional regulator of viral defense system